VTSSSVPTPSKVVGTRSFSEPFVARRGQKPECQRGVAGTLRRAVALLAIKTPTSKKRDRVIIDVSAPRRGDRDAPSDGLVAGSVADFDRLVITDPHVEAWPDGFPETLCTDYRHCMSPAPAGPPSPTDSSSAP
jgi:isocitrate dehydrogenase